jgi:hypothetical protein
MIAESKQPTRTAGFVGRLFARLWLRETRDRTAYERELEGEVAALARLNANDAADARRRFETLNDEYLAVKLERDKFEAEIEVHKKSIELLVKVVERENARVAAETAVFERTKSKAILGTNPAN